MNAPAAPSRKPEWLRGPLAWMAANPVAANLLMLVLLIGGWIIGSGVKQEVFPEFDADLVTIDIAYPGASPEAVEQGVVLAIEDAVRGIDGVKSVQSTSYEGAGFVLAEIITGQDADKITTDVKNAVDRITSFPEDAERPVTSLIAIKAKVITLMLHGQAELATTVASDKGRASSKYFGLQSKPSFKNHGDEEVLTQSRTTFHLCWVTEDSISSLDSAGLS